MTPGHGGEEHAADQHGGDTPEDQQIHGRLEKESKPHQEQSGTELVERYTPDKDQEASLQDGGVSIGGIVILDGHRYGFL